MMKILLLHYLTCKKKWWWWWRRHHHQYHRSFHLSFFCQVFFFVQKGKMYRHFITLFSIFKLLLLIVIMVIIIIIELLNHCCVISLLRCGVRYYVLVAWCLTTWLACCSANLLICRHAVKNALIFLSVYLSVSEWLTVWVIQTWWSLHSDK